MKTKKISTKICLIGDGGVGKTSLIGRFVYDIFSDKYIKTIGTKVSRKDILLVYPDKDLQFSVNAMIWDIMGQKAFGGLLHESYFKGARGILAVCNLTDKTTLEGLNDWIDKVMNSVGDIPVVILANKSDLTEKFEFGEEELKKFTSELKAPFLFTSAKTGENVSLAFYTIGKEILKKNYELT
jgi:small GTP-binding protein